ncbi:hypothetical protein PLEOSDRAFT_157607 [Pleurotus ostreatus PC15]|uniref:Ribonuclease H1 N-terminal domain-containing protein n=1 Tax=Pleurotus ostreatus (strain PC15) TaxID=1137138 RepID=A0A067NSC7_PLEO1|nr:hypothetical protein PLEOSDRAFT_157607 [Pleurotus ostreatus PC15]
MNTNANTAVGTQPLGFFRCPNCDVTHPLTVSLDVSTNTTTDNSGPCSAAAPGSSSSANQSANHGRSWYSVTRGRQVGVFQGWDDLVCSLVQGVPRWRCKRFATEQQARIHYNHALMMDDVHIHTDE